MECFSNATLTARRQPRRVAPLASRSCGARPARPGGGDRRGSRRGPRTRPVADRALAGLLEVLRSPPLPGRPVRAQPLVAALAGPLFRPVYTAVRGGHRRLLDMVAGIA